MVEFDTEEVVFSASLFPVERELVTTAESRSNSEEVFVRTGASLVLGSAGVFSPPPPLRYFPG